MVRYNRETGSVEDLKDVDAFLDEIIAICRKHGMSLGHEDRQGGFEVYREFNPDAAEWLSNAYVTEWK